ncbi:MAG TPA: choice-of-anchor J domain-containing protein, partial [Aquaticitalea sp.]|nr:choice-of-anchor J domain-containing protein [Aquaticitalea sp.]
MKNFYILLITLTFSLTGFGQIISQYVETDSGSVPKGIEIWNNTASTLNFSSNNLAIKQGTNGGTPAAVYTISTGTLAPGNVIVIGTSGDLETVTQGNGSDFYSYNFIFNGDDSLVIEYGGNETDVFGTPETDPGTAWTGGGVSTANQNIALNSGITTGSTGFSDPSTRFNTISTNPSGGSAALLGFGIAPVIPCTTATLPFAEGFEDGSVPPNCWDSFDNSVGTGQSWEIEDGSNYPAQSGTFSAKINPEFLASGTSEDWLVTPAIDLSPTTGNQLTFWGRRIFNTISGTNDYAVKISTTSQTDTGSFTDLQTYAATDFGMSFSQKTIDLSAYDGQTVYIAFVYTQNDGVGWIVDTINIEGTCDAPNTQASGYNTTGIDAFAGTATLNWTRGDGDNVLVVMREGSAVNANPVSGTSYTADAVFSDGDEIGSGNFVVYNGNSTSVNVSGLNMSSTYHVAVYEYNTTENCYNTDSLATGNFTVACETFSLPFTEGFEDGAIPACWATYRGTNGLGTINDWTINGDANT